MALERDDNTKSGDNRTQDMTAPDNTVIIDAPRELGYNQLRRLLGRGGMGEVWQAFDTQLERDVAIKLMRKEMLSNEEAVRRFTREARAVARLNHPNIVQVYAFGNEKGIAYMVMEMVEGETVAQCLKRHCKLTLEDTLHIILQAIEGLSYANARGIIHRDIKPSNLMLTEDNRVKIADFGLAKMVEHDTQMTAAGTAMGSPNYMSPEQARGEEADHRSDIYALGISLYQMLLGELPFTASSPVSVLLKQIQEPLPEPEHLRSLGNGQIMEVLRKMTHKLPESRYQTYGDLATALAALQPNVKFKGAHIATASMPAANTPTHVPTIAPHTPADGIASVSAKVAPDDPRLPPAPPVPPAHTPTPTGHGTEIISSKDVSAIVSPADENAGKRHPMLMPIAAGVAALLLAIPVLLFLLSDGQNADAPALAEDPALASSNGTGGNSSGSGTAPGPSVAPGQQPAPSPTPASAAPAPSPASTAGSLSASAPGSDMEPVDITAVFTPRITPPVGIPITATPTPDLTQLLPSSDVLVLGGSQNRPGDSIPLYDAAGNTISAAPAGTAVAMIRPAALNGTNWYVIRHNGGEAFVKNDQVHRLSGRGPTTANDAVPTAAMTPALPVYVLGTTGAGAGEQVPTFLDRNGRSSYKSFPAGTEVSLIESGSTMLRVKAPDDKIVYVFKRMASAK